MGTMDISVIEAHMLHRLSMLMAHERQLDRFAGQHPLIDPAYFSDLRMALLNCVQEFERVYRPLSTKAQRDAQIEQMAHG